MAYSDSIDTPWGRLEVRLPTPERVGPVSQAWPLRLEVWTDREDRDNARAEFQLPFEGPEGALPGAFMAHVPGPQTDALARLAATRRVLARATGLVAQAGIEGLVLLTATLREEGDGVATSGVGVFVIPQGADRQRAPQDVLEEGFEARLGPGGGALMGQALRALQQAGGSALPPVTGVKLVAAPYMGKRWLDFLALGPRVYCLQDPIDPGEPIWTDLADSGVRQVVHMPVGGSTPSLGFPRSVPREEGVLSAGGVRRVYRLLCHIAAVDGTIDPREREVLDDYRQRLGIQREDAGRLMQEGVRGMALEVGPTRLERALLMEGLLDVAAADGVLAPEEERTLVQLAEEIELPLEALHHALRTRFADQAPGAPESRVSQEVGPEGLRRVYRLLWNMAACDGEVDPLEAAFLEAFRERYGIGQVEAGPLAAQGIRGQELQIGRGVAERALLVEMLIALAAADGVLAPQEERKLQQLTATLGIPPAVVARELAQRIPPEQPAESSEHTGMVILLDVPHDVLAVDLLNVQLTPGFRGFSGVPEGVHRFGIPDARGEVACWVGLEGGEVAVLAYDGEQLGAADPARASRYEELAREGSLEEALAPFPPHGPWELLTTPLRAAPFPPRVHPPHQGPEEERLPQEWLGTHRGDGRALLAELAYAFLAGVFGDDPSAFDRWVSLVQAFYHTDVRWVRQEPALFVSLVDLLIAQQQLLPRDLLGGDSPLVRDARRLAEVLVLGEVEELAEAGKRWAVFCAGNHRPAARVPDAVEDSLQQLRQRIDQLEGESGPEDLHLLELLHRLAVLEEMVGQTEAALETRARLLRLAEAHGASPLDLALAQRRLARLARAAGREDTAAAAEARARELVARGRRVV